MDKRHLSERDICTKFITPALRQAGWDEMLQIREEVSFTTRRRLLDALLASALGHHDSGLQTPDLDKKICSAF
jgi:type I site-specific restriction endonuclease